MLDLKRAAAQAAFRRLARRADVIIENYRPGVMRRFGLDYEALSRDHPGLIYASISGYGQTGPSASKGGFDLVAQGVSGLMSITGEPGGPPVKVGVPLTDLGAGIVRAVGDPGGADLPHPHGPRPVHRHVARRSGRRAVGVGGDRVLFRQRHSAADGIGASDERAVSGGPLRGRLHHARGGERSPVRPAVRAAEPARVDPRSRLRGRHGPGPEQAQLAAAIESVTIDQTAAALARPARRERHSVRADQRLRAGVRRSADRRAGDGRWRSSTRRSARIRTLGSPLKMSETPPLVGRRAPLLGEHTEEVLREAGLSDEEITELGTEELRN